MPPTTIDTARAQRELMPEIHLSGRGYARDGRSFETTRSGVVVTPHNPVWRRCVCIPTSVVAITVPVESLVAPTPCRMGNKRLGWLTVVVSYGLNNLHLDAPDDDACDGLAIAIARGTVH